MPTPRLVTSRIYEVREFASIVKDSNLGYPDFPSYDLHNYGIVCSFENNTSGRRLRLLGLVGPLFSFYLLNSFVDKIGDSGSFPAVCSRTAKGDGAKHGLPVASEVRISHDNAGKVVWALPLQTLPSALSRRVVWT